MYGFDFGQIMCACGYNIRLVYKYFKFVVLSYLQRICTIQFENNTLGNVIINISVSYKDDNFCIAMYEIVKEQ